MKHLLLTTIAAELLVGCGAGEGKTGDFAFTFLVITTHLRKARNRQK
ncbi:hypothetical protein OAK15_03490 [Verrucomicrobia bacterium]|nr:hypothetical protein [Verrucomicrobiota bacterium]